MSPNPMKIDTQLLNIKINTSPIHFIENTERLQVEKRMLGRCYVDDLESRTSNYLEYEGLSIQTKHNMAVYCVYKLKEKIKNTSLFPNILRYLRGENVKYFKEIYIPEDIHRIIAHLSIYNDEVGIFRKFTNPQLLKEALSKIHNKGRLDFTKYKQSELAGILKAFLRESIGGIFHHEACKTIFKALSKENPELLLFIARYIPNSIDPQRRELFLKVIRMFKAIVSNSEVNKMSMENLIISSAPSFFPQIENPTADTCFYQSLIMETLINEVDFTIVKKEIVRETEVFAEECTKVEGFVFSKPSNMCID